MNKIMRRSSSSTSLLSSSSSTKLLPMIIKNNNNTNNNMMTGRQRQHHQQQYPLYQCKKHPKHRQSPGVCSLCLSDKLSKVVSSSTPTSRYAVIKARARAYYHYSSSSSSSSLSDEYDSSCESSGAASPSRAATAAHHRRIASDVRSSSKAIDGVLEDGATLFSKSKSMAHVEKDNNDFIDDEVNDNKKKKKKKKKKNVGVSKIWANLLRLGKHDQKRVNADVNINQHQTLPSSSSLVVY